MQLKHSSASLTNSCGACTFAIYAYIDNLLIASSSPEEHKHHLRRVLERLNDHSIVINPSKCVFGVAQLQFPCHQVDSKGIRPLEEKVQIIRDFPQPTTLCKLHEFFGISQLLPPLSPKLR